MSFPKLLLAPMAGWSDAAFRSICYEWGAELAFTEMVSAEGVVRGNPKTLRLLQRAENETHLGVQIFTSSPEAAFESVKRIMKFGPSFLNLNCGCSVPKILKTGSGASLLRCPTLIESIVQAMCESSRVPVMVKLRSGWDEQSINYIETSRSAVRGGASAICLHPRTRFQRFSGRADWSQIKRLKRESSAVVFGSGDLFRAEDAVSMMETTACDGVLLARGALGNPFIFREIEEILQTGKKRTRITVRLRLLTALKQAGIAVRQKGERTACLELRKHLCAYTKGIPGSAVLRNGMARASTLSEYEDLILSFLEG